MAGSCGDEADSLIDVVGPITGSWTVDHLIFAFDDIACDGGCGRLACGVAYSRWRMLRSALGIHNDAWAGRV